MPPTVSIAAFVMPEIGLWGPASTFHSRERKLIFGRRVSFVYVK